MVNLDLHSGPGCVRENYTAAQKEMCTLQETIVTAESEWLTDAVSKLDKEYLHNGNHYRGCSGSGTNASSLTAEMASDFIQ